jgi:CAAX protease family protein
MPRKANNNFARRFFYPLEAILDTRVVWSIECRVMSDLESGIKYIFVNEERELRSGWRVAVFIIAFILASILLTGILDGLAILFPSFRPLLRLPDSSEGASVRVFSYYALGQLTNLAGLVIASALCARLLERRSFSSVGYKLHRRWFRDFALGSLIGAGSLAAAVGIQSATGSVSFAASPKDALFLAQAFAYLFILFFIAAAVEELMFRGFAFQALLHNNGPLVAVAVTSILFGLAHIDNNNASFFSVFNTMLAGVWLGLAYLKTRSLWLATAMHYSWNLAMLYIFGLPVSGITQFNDLSLLRGQARSPVWISGGDYGPEAGAAVTVVIIISTLIIWKSGMLHPDSKMIAELEHGKREPRYVSIGINSSDGEKGFGEKEFERRDS